MTTKWGDRAAQIQSQSWGEHFATTALLTALPAAHRVDKMICTAAGKLYRFDSSSTATGAGTLTPDAGDGRWIEIVGGGTDFKDSVRVASTTNLVGTRTGNILLADANGAIAAMDGVTLAVNDRILMKDQTTGADKGIYVLTALGGASAKWSMTRAADFDTSAKVTAGCLIPVSEGTLGGNKTWQLTTNDPITLNTTALTFAAVGAAIGVATPQAVGAAGVAGSSGNAADEEHVHADPNRAAKGADLTDGDATIAIAGGTWRVLPATTLGANRTVTLGTTGAAAGDQIEITRLDATANTLAIVNGGVGAGTLITFPISKIGSAKFQFDGTNWALRSIGYQA